ncbi:hypothetical protein BAY61_25365 [Prauserella marina]|uniref:Uncharacterized protein n=1 Tax=Prauserella marina TaxID=530584 RepID=A0A222VV53_9PSEU|nr:hypothetical protein [Prauserella marina]ASR37780.1 hypothetical protein BAY61_25365 [Prauserella marina]PWV75733.1 hypothetical protein DES30_106351 [Prauserella marina]SDD27559.1 hypothetical protein SAMN05421630_10790 [Prauserella marina]
MAHESSRSRGAGVFDIRLIIALLIGVYGAVITVLGAGFMTEEDIEKSAGVNINLWAGIGMLVFAALFVAWAKWRPIKVPEHTEEESDITPGQER